MKDMDYEAFYNRVGKSIGWDFSRLKCTTEGEFAGWDMYQEVAEKCKKSDLLLDIGTGGGEAVLRLADAALLLVGIDLSTGMLETATQNLAASGASNVRFLEMDADKLAFPDHFFNVVSCRQSPFDAKEVARVIASGGSFISQQVSENDKWNLKEAFGRGQAYGIEAGTLKEQYETALREAGFSKVESFDFVLDEYYQSAEDLIFLLKHTPIIPHFGKDASDFEILKQFIQENQSDKGIRTQSARFVLKAVL